MKGLKDLKRGYASCLVSWSKSRFGSKSQIVHDGEPGGSAADYSPEIEKQLILALENCQLDSFMSIVKNTLSNQKSHSVKSHVSTIFAILLSIDAAIRKYELEIHDATEMIWANPCAIQELDSEHLAIEYFEQLAVKVIDAIRLSRCGEGINIVKTVRCFIDKNYAYDISLSMLAEKFHIHLSYLSELFKEQVGKTFKEYLTEVRMVKAEQLLRDSQLRIVDIAELVGIANASYFSTVFKKHFGRSPNDYRTERTL
ncbi:helix-turn-helix domain-containing protein [Paenibacillus alginolyticus]|uniref:helix-turn-helix domain-containing protein n=1 Tax=Paenibacillus alginolyticus TaxID=59839 RepID=UPI0015638D5C|nr:helix-turn-helix domain-containing protein [Paenibacillus frigoriresistens]